MEASRSTRGPMYGQGDPYRRTTGTGHEIDRPSEAPNTFFHTRNSYAAFWQGLTCKPSAAKPLALVDMEFIHSGRGFYAAAAEVNRS